MTVGLVFVIIALICFLLATAKVWPPIDLTALGLAFYMLSVLSGHLIK